jgi:hypothetical protein
MEQDRAANRGADASPAMTLAMSLSDSIGDDSVNYGATTKQL